MPLSHRLRAAVAFAGLLASAPALRAQGPALTAYTPTLISGTGLINAPVAWVSPEHGDIWTSISARDIYQGVTYSPKPSGSVWDLTMTADAHLFGRVSVGGSIYGTKNQQVGLHASLLALRQPKDAPWFLPSVAFGVRNFGSSKRQDRFVTGAKRVVDVLPASQRASRGDINGAPTVYGVATKEFTRENVSLGLTAGFGSGLFSESGGMDTVYNKSGTLAKGLFLGGRLAYAMSPDSRLSVIMENDGWDWNMGAVVNWGHFVVGMMLTEIEETKGIPANEPLANWTKTALVVGYNGSIPDIIRGSRQRREAVELQLEQQRLKREVKQRETRMNELEAQIAKARTRADAEANAQRAALEKALEAEREAAKRAADRLQQVKPGAKPPETL